MMKINTAKPSTGQLHRSKTDSYYNTKQHKSLRKQAYMRDGGNCVECGQAVSLHTTRKNTKFMAFADHKTPREAGGSDELDNIQTLCKRCHDIKSNKDKKYYR